MEKENIDLPFPELNNEINYLTLSGNITKKTIDTVSNKIVSYVEEHDTALKSYVKLKVLNDCVSNALKKIEKDAIEETNLYHKQEQSVYGIDFSHQTRVTYSFEHDEVWSDLERQIKALKEKQKRREEQMKSAMNVANAVDDDGVVIPVPQIKSTSEYIKLNIKKD